MACIYIRWIELMGYFMTIIFCGRLCSICLRNYAKLDTAGLGRCPLWRVQSRSILEIWHVASNRRVLQSMHLNMFLFLHIWKYSREALRLARYSEDPQLEITSRSSIGRSWLILMLYGGPHLGCQRRVQLTDCLFCLFEIYKQPLKG